MGEGFGIYFWPDGSQYRGTWDVNTINGKGAYIGSDGRWYKGTWQDSVIHGMGKYLWPNGREYAGQYLFDRMDLVSSYGPMGGNTRATGRRAGSMETVAAP